MIFTSVIIEDEKLARTTILSYLKRYFPQIEVIAELTSKKDAIHFLKSKKVDVVFLDVQLRDGLGQEIFKTLRAEDYKIIFTTAHQDFALDAFNVKAFGYLLKPINPIDFKEIVGRVLESLSSNSIKNKSIKISVTNGHVWIDTDNIVRCESQSNYTILHTKDNAMYTISKTLKYVEEDIINSKDFIRIHQSHLINIKYILEKKIIHNFIYVYGNHRLPVARAKKIDLTNIFANSKKESL
jgi:two-component system LytT family response regulator